MFYNKDGEQITREERGELLVDRKYCQIGSATSGDMLVSTIDCVEFIYNFIKSNAKETKII